MIKALQKNMKGLFLMLMCALCLCLGQLVWKIMPGIHIGYLIGGFAFLGTGSILMLLAYKHGELSVLQPVNSMSYVFSLFLGYFVLHEAIAIKEVLGVLIIVISVILIGSCKET